MFFLAIFQGNYFGRTSLLTLSLSFLSVKNGGSSFAGYGLLGLQRRARVFEITDYGEKVRTYHRLELGEDRLDETTLYDGRA